MSDDEFLAHEFDTHRTRLRAVAYRVLGTYGDADDAVQEAWLRLAGTDRDSIDNLSGWLTTVVSRICLDMLRSRRARAEDELDDGDAPSAPVTEEPEFVAVHDDSVTGALLVVLDRLGPAERLAFVLHDLFGVPFEQIAAVIERSPDATRQLASRARRRLREADVSSAREQQRSAVSAFLRASRSGDLAGLLEVLDPEIELRADRVAVAAAAAAPGGAPDIDSSLHGVHAVAAAFQGRARGAELALIDGVIGAVYAPGGHVLSAIAARVEEGRIVRIDMCADQDTIAGMRIEILGRP
ncbi:RNA polymerase sigma factor [Flexivirga endophytica]|uniref:RNA polymerase sigma factor n=1 Tax=Flexivirga endophytica TaxID=1849103 RepID=A0A916WTG2_9MICO|nr:sigma-70 family RNA polymerase sigma factor [Flexivirga endophytica]GGB28350.1 RNA polymerase sigma factor [Flexivirga endophytica]GHB62097.1 RNA polymerase sigma factor [Flexivirga endophytica]